MKTIAPGTLWLPGMDPNAPLYQPLTLRRYFDDTLLPLLRNRGLSSSRINELKLAVFRFIWWHGQERRTGCPSLQDVNAGNLASFREYCLARQIPGQDGRLRPCTARALNKSLQGLEQVVAAAVEDQTLDDSRGITKVRKVAGPRQIGKLVIPDPAIESLWHACGTATWPKQDSEGRAIDAPLLWKTALVLLSNYGMRTQDLLRFESTLRPMRWGCVIPPGLSPSEDGTCESEFGWLYWIPNKTRNRKDFALTLPLNATTAHWIGLWRDSLRPKPTDALIPIPACQKSLYAQWKRIVAEAGVKPKPKRTFDSEGNQTIVAREYKIKHFRCTAGTRADDHGSTLQLPDVGRWITGHVSNDVFERHYRDQEPKLKRVLETLPQPKGFTPGPKTDETSAARKPDRPTLRVVG
jgi:hypothetical protein